MLVSDPDDGGLVKPTAELIELGDGDRAMLPMPARFGRAAAS